MKETDSTGLIIIDDIINSGQNFSIDNFITYYKNRGINLEDCVSVETNFKIKKQKNIMVSR